MRGYELLYAVHPGTEEEKIKQIEDKVKKALTDNGAKIIADENLGKREFAYPIKKQNSGYYIRLEFEADGKALKEMKRVIGVTDAIIREMCVTLKSIRNKEQPEEKELAA